RISSLSYSEDYPILISARSGSSYAFSEFGESFTDSGECLLFPSKEQRDWRKWEADRAPKFKPFDRVLVRCNDEEWSCDLFSHITKNDEYKYTCLAMSWKQCIPYEGNEHLLGTTDKPNK
ncbi:MAG: hypothetical protein ACRCZZ_07185, partial [Phocaeicola sp.]